MKSTFSMLKPVSRTTLSEQVAKRLGAELEAKRWAPGEKLPSEAELCKVFNVGRSTLREALKSLSFIGLIRMVAGGGSFVAEQRSKFLEGSLLLSQGVLNTEEEINNFCEARLLIETELAGLCAQKVSAKDLRTIEKMQSDMKAAMDHNPDQFPDLDLSFHLAIATGAGNPVLTELMKHIRVGLEEMITKSIYLPAGMTLAYKQHGAILEALKQRNPGSARKAMRTHVRTFQRGYSVLLQKLPGNNRSSRS